MTLGDNPARAINQYTIQRLQLMVGAYSRVIRLIRVIRISRVIRVIRVIRVMVVSTICERLKALVVGAMFPEVICRGMSRRESRV